ncbi:MAG: hypothetical protein [Podoviridae sp. ctda_1]|nr:MAG: hypothetical protein [Podoviridae sp. ctda_1]
MSEVQPQTIREQLAEAVAAKDILKSLERLQSNRDFRKLIVDDFMGTNMIRQVGVSIDSDFEDENTRKYAVGEAQAGAYLKRWLMAQKAMLRQLISTIPKLEEALAEQDQVDPGHDMDEAEADEDEGQE